MVTFGIVTNGKRPEKLWREIQTIHDLKVTEYEIIVCGELPENPARTDYTYIPTVAAKMGQLGRMRNLICEAAKHDTIVITDDDIIFTTDFYIGLLTYGDDYDILCTKLLNPDGTRNWDWVTKGGPRGHILLEYYETDPYIYCTGGRIVLHRNVWDKVKWDDMRGMNQEEDVDFSHRATAAGFSIKMNTRSTLIHDDPRYTSAGHKMYFKE